MKIVKNPTWVSYNTITHTYDTPNGTKIPAELADNCTSLLDVLYIAILRDEQKRSVRKSAPKIVSSRNPSPQPRIVRSR